MRPKPNPRHYLARTLAMALACLLVLFLVQVVVHAHEKGHNESACRICHAAHAGSLPAAGVFLLDEPLRISGLVHEDSRKFHKDFFVNDSPSRAPPAA
jgi:hypothetical protein